jgi:hypothetical protein
MWDLILLFLSFFFCQLSLWETLHLPLV